MKVQIVSYKALCPGYCSELLDRMKTIEINRIVLIIAGFYFWTSLKSSCTAHSIINTTVTLIRNQQESSRTSRNEEFSKFAPHSGGNFKPYSHTRGGMSRNDVGMEILYIFLDSAVFWITSGLIRGPIGTFQLHSSRIRAAIERFRRHFELHSSWILLISK